MLQLNAGACLDVRAAHRQLEEETAAAAGDGTVRLDGAQQAEYWRIKEEAKSKTSRLQADHDVLAAAQVRRGCWGRGCCRLGCFLLLMAEGCRGVMPACICAAPTAKEV